MEFKTEGGLVNFKSRNPCDIPESFGVSLNNLNSPKNPN